MKIISFVSLLSMALYGAIGSSVKVPAAEHLKYTFGNHKNHPIQKIEAQRYYHSLAVLDDHQIREKLSAMGCKVSSLTLSDIVFELLYVAKVSDKSGEKMKLYLDPSTGTILKSEALR